MYALLDILIIDVIILCKSLGGLNKLLTATLEINLK